MLELCLYLASQLIYHYTCMFTYVSAGNVWLGFAEMQQWPKIQDESF